MGEMLTEFIEVGFSPPIGFRVLGFRALGFRVSGPEFLNFQALFRGARISYLPKMGSPVLPAPPSGLRAGGYSGGQAEDLVGECCVSRQVAAVR